MRSLVHLIERCGDVNVYRMTEGANEAGCHIAGALPHRGACGETIDKAGLDIQTTLNQRVLGALLLNVEPELDVADPYKARQSLLGAEFVTVISSYQSESMLDYADILLPAATTLETSGTFVNAMGNWQSFSGVTACLGEARPAWKILRVLANLFELSGFDYESSQEVLNELKLKQKIASPLRLEWHNPNSVEIEDCDELVRVAEWPMYRIDAMTRHAVPLQNSAANDVPCIKLHSKTAKKYDLSETATVSQGNIEITLPLIIDDKIAENVAFVANAWPETSDLGSSFGSITLK